MTLTQLTRQQRRVLVLVAAGCSTKQLADRLGISQRTAQWHVSRLLIALEAPTRAALIRTAMRRGLLSEHD